MKMTLIFVAVVALLIAVPLMTIWSLNNLFVLGIPYTMNTWASAWSLGFIFGGGAYAVSKKS